MKFLLLIVGLCVFVADAHAQVIEPPDRGGQRQLGMRTRDPDRFHQALTFQFDTLAGYDDNLKPDGADAITDFAFRPSGYTGMGMARLGYISQRNERVFSVDGQSFMNAYRNLGLVPAYGGSVKLDARVPVGRQGRLDVRQLVRYDPFYTLGAFNLIQADAATQLFDTGPVTGITERRSWTNDTVVAFNQQFTPRTAVQLDYAFNKQTYNTRAGFDSRIHGGRVALDRSLGRTTGVVASYRYSDVRALDLENKSRPFQDHNLDGGFRYRRNLTRTRAVALTVGAGATYVETINEVTRFRLTYWSPTGYVTGSLDMGRSWVVAGNYRRGVALLQGLTQSPTDAFNATIGGLVAPRVDLTMTAASSNGGAGGGGDASGQFRSYVVAGQLRVAIMEGWSAFVSYTRYKYELDATASAALGVTPEMNRNAVRVGFSLAVPLIGGN